MTIQLCNIVIPIEFSISQSRKRLDYALSILLPNYSRSQIKRWILSGQVKVDDQIIVVPNKKVIGGERIEIIGIVDHINYNMYPQNIPLDIVYEDDDIVVINKSNNMVVHPGAGNCSGTILNALLYKYPSIIKVSRAGIVHRLDKDTTGLMVIAKNIVSYNNLLQLFKTRQIIREYEAIVFGKFTNNQGMINQPIKRHDVCRTRMAVHSKGKQAITHFQVIQTFGTTTINISRIRVWLETGRTHQIRVHMAYIHHPLIGDQKYGKRIGPYIKKMLFNDELSDYLDIFNRQALHACMLQLLHPTTGLKMKWNISLPQDMMNLVKILSQFNTIAVLYILCFYKL